MILSDTAFLKSPDLGGSVSDGKDAYKLGTEIFKVRRIMLTGDTLCTYPCLFYASYIFISVIAYIHS